MLSLWLDQEICDDADGDGTPDGCKIVHRWFQWNEAAMCMAPLPGTTIPPCSTDAWADPDGNVAWTGFYGGKGVAAARGYVVGTAYVPPTSIGARVLGQQVNDHFGTAVASDGTWLYISAPDHTALMEDVPSLTADRTKSGVVYQLRTKKNVPGQPNLAQLWMEPGPQWPEIDAEIAGRTDYTMPVPHQYIIETIGSVRGNYDFSLPDAFIYDLDDCPKFTLNLIVTLGIDKAWATIDPITFDVSAAPEVSKYVWDYTTDTAGYSMDRTPQIVGPHDNARISHVQALGDVNGDGLRDFAVGSEYIEDPATGEVVGAVYIVYSQQIGEEGDYLLENLHLAPSDPSRLTGVMLKGASAGEKLARVLDDAGNVNGDAFADVVVGNENGNGGTGEAIVIFGSQFLESPENGWTIAGIVSDTQAKAVRFKGENVGDLAGANVAGAGDVDGDGFSDILVAAPGYPGGQNIGAVYLIYGAASLEGEIDLAQIGTTNLPGARFLGRAAGDQLGGGTKVVVGTMPSDPSAAFTAHSRGVARLGDIDGDGRDDYAISAMLADPNEKVDSGEVYILYGKGDPLP